MGGACSCATCCSETHPRMAESQRASGNKSVFSNIVFNTVVKDNVDSLSTGAAANSSTGEGGSNRKKGKRRRSMDSRGGAGPEAPPASNGVEHSASMNASSSTHKSSMMSSITSGTSAGTPPHDTSVDAEPPPLLSLTEPNPTPVVTPPPAPTQPPSQPKQHDDFEHSPSSSRLSPHLMQTESTLETESGVPPNGLERSAEALSRSAEAVSPETPHDPPPASQSRSTSSNSGKEVAVVGNNPLDIPSVAVVPSGSEEVKHDASSLTTKLLQEHSEALQNSTSSRTHTTDEKENSGTNLKHRHADRKRNSYFAIQEYLSECVPPTAFEADLLQLTASTEESSSGSAGGRNNASASFDTPERILLMDMPEAEDDVESPPPPETFSNPPGEHRKRHKERAPGTPEPSDLAAFGLMGGGTGEQDDDSMSSSSVKDSEWMYNLDGLDKEYKEREKQRSNFGSTAGPTKKKHPSTEVILV